MKTQYVSWCRYGRGNIFRTEAAFLLQLQIKLKFSMHNLQCDILLEKMAHLEKAKH